MQRPLISYWLFQANPRVFDIREKLEEKQTYPWVVSRYHTRIKQGDVVFFWHSREQAVYGTGRIDNPPEWYKMDDNGTCDYRVNVLTETRYEKSIGYEKIREDDQLGRLSVLQDSKGTNFPLTPAEASTLGRLGGLPLPELESLKDHADDSLHLYTHKHDLTLMHVSDDVRQILDLTRATPENIIHTLSVIMSASPLAGNLAGEKSSLKFAETPNDQVYLWIQDIFEKEPEFKSFFSIVDLNTGQIEADFWDESVTPEGLMHLDFGGGPYVSPTLADIYEHALEITGKVSGPVETDVRHLCGAFLSHESGSTDRFLEKIGLTRERLRSSFLDMVKNVFPDDDAEAWQQAFAPAIPDFVLLGYSADEDKGEDALGIEGEVDAFASVIASRVMQPPLSIGLFGNWGSGKSFFMLKLIQRVSELARSAGRVNPEGKKIADMRSAYYPNIVQIHFNAWHYVEANLWASLVTTIFDNLRVQKDDPAELLEDRRNEAIKQMETAANLKQKAKDDLDAANRRVKMLRDTLTSLECQRKNKLNHRVVLEVLGELASSDWSDVFGNKVKETRDALDTGDIKAFKKSMADLNKSAKDATVSWGRVKTFFRSVGKLGSANFIWLCLLIAIGGGIYLLIPDIAAKLGTDWQAKLGAAAAAIATLAGWLRAIGQKGSTFLLFAEKVQSKLTSALAEYAPEPGDPDTDIQEELGYLEVHIQELQHQLEQAVERAEKAQVEAEELESGAMLARFIEERATSTDYREKLGLLALIREDFSRLSIHLKNTREENIELDKPGRIDRIVLYIDDLDRCPPERVYEVLQAIHLLLAFDLFVVVVGVDQRWLANSLVVARSGLMSSGDDAIRKGLAEKGVELLHAAEPKDFIEKIFQIPFWLRPISEKGYQRMIGHLVGLDKSLGLVTESPTTVKSHLKPGAGYQANKPGGIGAPGSINFNQTVAQQPGSSGSGNDQVVLGNEPEPGDLSAVRPEVIAIGEPETMLMQRLLALVGRSPRTTKRFVNLYRVIKARELVSKGWESLDDQRLLAGMFLLAVVTGNPTGGEKLLKTINRAKKDESFNRWFRQFSTLPAKADTENIGKEEQMDDHTDQQAQADDLDKAEKIAPQKPGSSTNEDDKLPKAVYACLKDLADNEFKAIEMALFLDWLPIIRRFSFDAEVANDTEHAKIFQKH